MQRRSNITRAKRLYRAFREAEPTRIQKLSVSIPRAVMVIGRVDFVGYTTTHKNVSTSYKHTFAKGSAPLLCSDGKKLYLLKGRYRVTGRGIVDIDSHGREEK